MLINRADAGSFRAVLSGEFYARWRRDLGSRAWELLEGEVGRRL